MHRASSLMMMMMFSVLVLVFMASAFPSMADVIETRQAVPPVPLPLSQNEPNCGIIPCPTFDAADQFVDVRPGTPHQFVPPTASDRRGPCSGLNAAANHGFIPHNGIGTVTQFATGLQQAYNMDIPLSTVLATIGVALTGDVLGGTWSIGGPYSAGLLGSLLSSPKGLSYSHNLYETDGSVTRADAYMNNGDSSTLQMDRFMALYNRSELYTLDIMRQHNKAMRDWSVQNNPYYFSAPFAGLVAPIAHTLIPLMFSNHSAENPNGYIDRGILKSFHGITGPEGAFKYTPGHERIPNNWYRRPSYNRLGIVNGFADLGVTAARFPELISIGGNTGTVNSFVGVNPKDISGGVFNATTLLQGNNLACFVLQGVQAATPSILSGLVSTLSLSNILQLLGSVINPAVASLTCPSMSTIYTSQLNQCPGRNYRPVP
ncbi:uncharacterized protein L3040_000446 [Drepanopeziza brunnea f. sp. 'multigermtubi']|uniref:uncharacterized protein n=1 Tax=Drepanopeziza brunnea f. sp. 'multigermtubi' TaxID=698441 RepID=UPI0023A5E0E0|nr:hypothetical protein L3040_000446 [Drepanopeziza brunnea f. sp. 'multigermtubi']